MENSLDPAPSLLEVRGISKSFGAVRALQEVDFTLRAGEIHALLGENGAGKSTLIKVVTGVFPRDAGVVRLGGEEVAPRSAKAALQAGIATVYQEVNLLPNLSVAQNLFLGRQPMRFGIVREGEMRRRAKALLAEFGLDIDVAAPLGNYSVAIQHVTAIARAVDLSARVLILDEPTASLDRHEVEILFGIMRQLAKRGIGIVFVSHFLDQVYEISDRITVLRNGRLVGERETASLPRLELIRMMLGRELAETTGARAATGERPPREICASFENYGKAGYVAPFNLELRHGEVVGLAGLLGSGRTETARLVFGAERADSGQARVEGALCAAAVAARWRAPRLWLLPGGAQDRRHRRRTHRAREHRAGAAGQARAASAAVATRAGRDRAPLRQDARHPPARCRNGPSACSPAAISRRCCWRAGSRPRRGSSCWTSRRAASMSARMPRSSA